MRFWMTENVPQELKTNKIVPIHAQQEIPDDFPKNAVQKGVYDINYAITLLRSIEGMVDKYNHYDLKFTLKTSLRKMICYLEVERDQMRM